MSTEAESPSKREIVIIHEDHASPAPSSDEPSAKPDVVPSSTSGDAILNESSDADPVPSTSEPSGANAQPASDDVFSNLRDSVYMDPRVPLSELLSRSDYLQKYPSWLGFCGPENKKKYAPTFLARNDTIWELIFSERGYVDMLLMVHDVYMTPFPQFNAGQFDMLPQSMSSKTLYETLFPGLNELLAAHERILRPLLALHNQAENHVVESLGSCLVKLFDAETQSSLSHLYGRFLFAQKRIRQELQICKRCPLVAQFLENCKHDPRSSRKSLEDCHMVIVQRWTKVETLLEAIIKNTLNRPSEVESLEVARNTVRSLLKKAEAMMTRMEHAEKLTEFANLLYIPPGASEDQIEVQLLNEMRSPENTLVNYSLLRVTPIVAGQQHHGAALVSGGEAIGIALNSCFFMLQRMPDTDRYQLFKNTQMPPILWWGKVFGYFRRAVEKGAFGFFILLHSNVVMTRFHCQTVDEVDRWEQIWNDGFAQWKEGTSTTAEALNEDLVKTRSAISERWQRTESIIELLHELDKDWIQAWIARIAICEALISERLKLHASGRRATLDTINSDRVSLTGSQSGISRTRSKNSVSTITSGPVTSVSSEVTAVSPRNSAKFDGTDLSPVDVLQKNTYIDNLTVNKDLERLFSRFQENLARLSFALVGSYSAGLSRSASDVEERKRPLVKCLRKNETFSVRDIGSYFVDALYLEHYASDPKLLNDVRKTKKRDAHRLSTVANIFRSSSRDKSNGPTISQQGSLDLSLFAQMKGMRNQPPPFNLGVTTSPGSHLSGPASSTSPVSNSMPPRSSLNLAQGQGAGDGVDGSGNGSCTSLLSQPMSEALTLLRDLNQVAEEIYPLICDVCTANVELRAEVQYLTADRNALDESHRRAIEHGLHAQNCTRASGGGADGSDVAVPALTVKQETEKLRRDYASFIRKAEKWEEQRQRQRDAIDRDLTKLAEERNLLSKEREDLERRQRQYDEKCKTLQDLIELYSSRGITMPELRIPDISVGRVSPMNPDHSRGSCTSLGDLDPTVCTPTRQTPSPVHLHSTSDDLSSKWAFRPECRRHPSVSIYEAENTPRPSLVPTNLLRHEDLPEHLRGSILNQSLNTHRQPSTPRSTPDSGNPESRLTNSWSASNPNASTPSLMKLAESSKVRATQKSKKSSRFGIR